MIQLDDALLVELGLADLSPKDRKSILGFMYETLELRVGTALAGAMTEAQLAEFEVFVDNDDADGSSAWLAENVPEYRSVVARLFEELKAEVRGQADAIVAAVRD